MIPAFLVTRYGPELAAKIVKVAMWAALALAIVALLLVTKCQYDQRAKTEVKLATGQHGAAIATGHDAVETLGNRMAADAAGQVTVEETQDAIDNATDAGGVTAAGRSGLCRLSGYKNKPECVANPK